MAYVINDSCVACGACESQCPVGAISMCRTVSYRCYFRRIGELKAFHHMMEGFFFNPKRTVFFFSSFSFFFPFLLL